MPFSEYLDQQNEAMLSGMSARETTPVGYDPLASYRGIVAGRAAGEYSRAMSAQSDKEFLHQMIGTGVGSVMGAFGGMGGFLGGSMGYNWMAGQLGWLEQQEMYDRDDYITGNMAEATFMSAYRTMDPFAFGRRGMTGDQASEMAERLLPTMRGQGFDGMELTRMLPILEEQGALRPQGNFSSTEEALEEFETRISGFVERIGNIVRQTNMDIETATYLSTTETMMAGGEGALGTGERGLMDIMRATSGATGLSYDDSLSLIRGDVAPWEHSTANLLPMAESMSATYGGANLASTSGAWGTAWMRSGAQETASHYNQIGQRFFDAHTKDLGRLYASSGGISRENMMALAAGEDVFDDLDSIDDMNERYEARYFARQELAAEPELMAAAGMGQLIAVMEGEEITSRVGQIEYMREMGYEEDRATTLLNLHDTMSTPEGRFGSYLGTQQTYRDEQRQRIESGVETAIEHAQVLTESSAGSRDIQYLPTVLRGMYSDFDQGDALMSLARGTLREQMEGLTVGTSVGDILMTPGELRGDQLSILDLRTTLDTALRGENVSYTSGDILTGALGRMRGNYEDQLGEASSFDEMISARKGLQDIEKLSGLMDLSETDLMEIQGLIPWYGVVKDSLMHELTGATREEVAALQGGYDDLDIMAVTPTTSGAIAGRNIVQRSGGALGGMYFGGTFDSQQVEDAQNYNQAMEGVTILQRSPENMQNFRAPLSPHRERFTEFLSEVEDKEISLDNVLGSMESEYGSLSPSNWEHQAELRNRFAQEIYGDDFLSVDEDKQGYIEEYIMQNDGSAMPGTGNQDWGGSHSNVMSTAQQELRERAGALVESRDMRSYDRVQEIETSVLSEEKYEDISGGDLRLYAQHRLGSLALAGMERGSEDFSAMQEDMSRIEEQLGPSMDTIGLAYSDIRRRSNIFLESNELLGMYADPGGAQTYQMMAAGIGDARLTTGQQGILYEALSKNDTSLIEGAEWVSGLGEENLIYQWSEDKISREDLNQQLRGEMPSGIAQDITGAVDEVRSTFNRTVQRVAPAGDAMPVILTNIDALRTGSLSNLLMGRHVAGLESGPAQSDGAGVE